MNDQYFKITMEEWEKMIAPIQHLPNAGAKKALLFLSSHVCMVEIDGVKYLQAITDADDEFLRGIYKRMIESE